jgi:hypothetical protein
LAVMATRLHSLTLSVGSQALALSQVLTMFTEWLTND